MGRSVYYVQAYSSIASPLIIKESVDCLICLAPLIEPFDSLSCVCMDRKKGLPLYRTMFRRKSTGLRTSSIIVVRKREGRFINLYTS